MKINHLSVSCLPSTLVSQTDVGCKGPVRDYSYCRVHGSWKEVNWVMGPKSGSRRQYIGPIAWSQRRCLGKEGPPDNSCGGVVNQPLAKREGEGGGGKQVKVASRTRLPKAAKTDNKSQNFVPPEIQEALAVGIDILKFDLPIVGIHFPSIQSSLCTGTQDICKGPPIITTMAPKNRIIIDTDPGTKF